MPQMSPLSWINLLVTFILVFLIMNTLNYFSFQYTSIPSTKTLVKKSINWKW